MEYSREELIKICVKAIVPEWVWSDRDSASAHIQIGKCWVLLKAGCKFRILTKKAHASDGCVTDEWTIWVEIEHKCFNSFETDDEIRKTDFFYLPTPKRLKDRKGKDWY